MRTNHIHKELYSMLYSALNGKEIQKRGDIYLYIWVMNFPVQQKLTQHCKATILQIFFLIENSLSAFTNTYSKFSSFHSLSSSDAMLICAVSVTAAMISSFLKSV